jgi:hypothetical protein
MHMTLWRRLERTGKRIQLDERTLICLKLPGQILTDVPRAAADNLSNYQIIEERLYQTKFQSDSAGRAAPPGEELWKLDEDGQKKKEKRSRCLLQSSQAVA